MALSPWLLWLDWLVGAVVVGVGAGAQSGASRGLHGKWRQNQYPPTAMRAQGLGTPWKRASNSGKGV